MPPSGILLSIYFKTLPCGYDAVAFIFSIYLKPVLYHMISWRNKLLLNILRYPPFSHGSCEIITTIYLKRQLDVSFLSIYALIWRVVRLVGGYMKMFALYICHELICFPEKITATSYLRKDRTTTTVLVLSKLKK